MAEAAKAWLLSPNDAGVSVYGHITDVLAQLLEAQPTDPLDSFETVSKDVKASYFTPESAIPPDAPTAAPDADKSTLWQQGCTALLKAKPAQEEEEDTEGLNISNLMEELQLMEWAGVGLSQEEAHRVHTSIVKLQLSKRLATARFFGKVLGTSADYYIVEGTYVEEPEKEEEEAAATQIPVEERGTGCNTCVYFATNDPALPWQELSDVTPEQVAASRGIRKYFTGDLAAPVRAFPPFPGCEREYLRAQIARIVHGTVLCPKGKFALDGDDEEEGPRAVVEVDAEEYVPLSGAEMAKPGSWCHYYMGILGIGRCTNPPAEEEEEKEDGDPKPKGRAPEAEKQALSTISGADWALHVYPRMGGQPVTVARSLQWPGAHAAAVMKEDRFTNLYFGYGHEALGKAFSPMPSPPIEQEAEDLQEQQDPPLAEENAAVIAAARAKLEEEAEAEEGEE